MSRGWTDDGDRIVECNLAILTANGECAALTGNNLNFGGLSGNITQVNQDTLRGWGARDYDWQWSIGVQQEVLPRVSADVAYARRSFHSFTITDNQARDPSQYDAWTINAPSDPRLPGGGGYPITRLYADGGGGGDPGSELHHVGDRLRTGSLQLLAGGGLHGQRADAPGTDAPVRHQHRPQDRRHVRDRREDRQP